jgi:hypothetical protein
MAAKKIVKKALKITGIALALLLVLMIVLPFVFKKQIVSKVLDEVNKNLNATVHISDFHLSLFRNFPDFTLGLDSVSVVGQKDFKNDTLAAIPSLKLTIGLMSVIKGDQYNIKKIDINHPKILLKVLKDGQANWDITKPSADTTKKEETSSWPFKLSIKKLNIENGYIVYMDDESGMYATVQNMNHVLKGDLSDDFTSLYTKTNIDSLTFSYGGITYLKKANVALEADLDADMANSKYTFKENELQLNQLFLGFDGWIAMPGDDIQMDMKFHTKKTDFKNLLSMIPAIFMKDFDGIETKGSLALDGYAKGIYTGNILPAFSVNLKVDNGMFKYPSLPKAVSNIQLNVTASNKDGIPDHTIIDVKKLHAEMGSNPADVVMLVSTPVSDPAIDGTVKLKLNLAEVKDFYPLEAGQQLNGLLKADVYLKGRMSSIEKERYEEFQAKGEISVERMTYKSKDIAQTVKINTLKLLFSPKFVDMPVCDVVAGKSDIKASGRLDNLLSFIFKDDMLLGHFECRSHLLDLNEFMSSDESATTTENTSTSEASVIEIPKNIHFNVKTSADKILYDNLVMEKVVGVVNIADRKLSIDQLKTNMLNGSLMVNGYYSTQKNDPEVDFNLDINHFDLPLTYKTFTTVQKFAPIIEKCSGFANIKMKLNTSFDKTMTPLYNTLQANGTLSATNIEVKGFEVLTKIADALKIDKFRRLGIDKVAINFTIADGKINVKPYTFTFEKIKTTVSGWNSLDQSINYDLICEIPRELFGGAANGVLNNLVSQANSKGLNIQPGNTIVVAIKVGGTMSKPVITTNIKKSVGDAVNDIKEQAKEVVKDKINETVTNAKNEVSAQAQKIMDEARAKAQQLKDEAKKAGDALVAEAEKQGQALVDQAKNPLAKAAAKESAKQLVKVAQDKSNKLQQEAAVKADKIIADAQVQADRLKK